MSNSLRTHGLKPARLLYPWNSPGKNTGVGCHFFIQEIFPTRGLNLSLLHCLTFRKLGSWHLVPSLQGKQMGKQWKQCQTLFFWAPKSLQMVTAAMKLRDAYSLEGSYDQPRQHIKKQRHYFANKGPSSQSYGFSCSHVWM